MKEKKTVFFSSISWLMKLSARPMNWLWNCEQTAIIAFRCSQYRCFNLNWLDVASIGHEKSGVLLQRAFFPYSWIFSAHLTVLCDSNCMQPSLRSFNAINRMKEKSEISFYDSGKNAASLMPESLVSHVSEFECT